MIYWVLVALAALLAAGPTLAEAQQLDSQRLGALQYRFIGPDGDKFVSIGVNHIEPHLWLAPYNKTATLKRYGADMINKRGFFNPKGQAAKKWIDQQVKTCRDLHFNTLGRHTHPSIDPKLYRDQIYYVVSLQTGPLAGRGFVSGWCPLRGHRGFVQEQLSC